MINLYHIARALMSSVHESPQMALKRLHAAAPLRLKEFLRLDHAGNTVLHHAAMKRMSETSLKQILTTTGEEAAVVMAKMVNNEGEIPLEIAENSFKDAPDEFIPTKLYLLTKQHDSKPLHEKCDEDEILAPYKDKQISKGLLRNLVIACAAVNMVRGLKLASSTDYAMNEMEPEEQYALCNRVSAMRDEHAEKIDELHKSLNRRTIESSSRQLMRIAVTTPIKHDVANWVSMQSLHYIGW